VAECRRGDEYPCTQNGGDDSWLAGGEKAINMNAIIVSRQYKNVLTKYFCTDTIQ